MDKSDIVTFMKDSVASRCENRGFRDFVTEFLIGKLGMDESDLVTFMKGSVASRCENRDFIIEFLIGNSLPCRKNGEEEEGSTTT